MAISPKDKKVGSLVLITIIGLLIGSYISLLVTLIPGGHNVVKTFFTYNLIPFGVGYPNPMSLDLWAIKFQFGISMKFNLMSIVGIGVALYMYRWYK